MFLFATVSRLALGCIEYSDTGEWDKSVGE